MARDLKLLGINTPEDLKGRDPLELYRCLCDRRSARQDPCVFDVFLSITRFRDRISATTGIPFRVGEGTMP